MRMSEERKFVLAVLALVLCALVLVWLSGLSAARGLDGKNTDISSETQICRDGVLFHVFGGHKRLAVTPAFNPDGSLQTCEVVQ